VSSTATKALPPSTEQPPCAVGVATEPQPKWWPDALQACSCGEKTQSWCN
jgi:hypothetical protein